MSNNFRNHDLEKQAEQRINLGMIQEAIVKSVEDSACMGRLKVWIKGSASLEDDAASWITANYGGPFAGASNPALLGRTASNPATTQTSYGIWAVPPDAGNTVLVAFVNGDIRRCYWIACIYQKDMNHMVPGIAADDSYQAQEYPGAVPVNEYNKLSGNDKLRPANATLAAGLAKQGLLSDALRGAGSASARRESPSAVNGWLTPGGSQFIMDDLAGNALIRLRTASGAQMLISETYGHVYAMTRDGNSWLELNNDGHVDVYASAGYSVHTQGDVNYHAAGNVNIQGNAVNIAGNSINIAGSSMNLQSTGAFNVLSGGSYNITYQGNITSWQVSTGTVYHDAFSHVTQTIASPASPPSAPASHVQSMVNSAGESSTANTIVTRLPDHEPWPYHGDQGGAPLPTAQLGTSSVSTGSIASNATAPLPLVGTPAANMPAGIYTPTGYTSSGQPEFTYAGATHLLMPVQGLTTSSQGLEFIKTQEGFRATPYRDASGLAYDIGYAHTITPQDPKNIQTGPITIEDATALLAQDVKKFEASIRSLVKVPLTQNQFDALVDFVYDVGPARFASSTLLKTLNAGMYANVVSELQRWVYAAGVVLPALVSRRRQEALIFAQTSSVET